MADPALTLLYDFTRQPDLRAVNGLGPTLGITRTTTATFLDQDSIIRTAAAGEARFTGARRVENLCLQSEDFDTTWVDTGVTSTADQAANPLDDAVTADLIDSGTADASARRHSVQTVNSSPLYGKTAQFTCSVYAKGVVGDNNIVVLEGGDAVWHGVVFDLDLGTIDPDGTDPLSNDVDAYGIEDVGDGWFRCWMQYTSTNGADLVFYLGAVPDEVTNTGPEAAWNPDTLGQQSAYFWGAQVEMTSGQLDPAPSGYIPTTTAAVAINHPTERRTNLLLQSQTLTVSPWAYTTAGDGVEAVVTDAYAVAPDGTTTATRLQLDLGGGTTTGDHSQRRQNHTAIGTRNFSVYLKSNDANTYAAQIISPTGAGTAVSITPTWQRFEVTGTAPGTAIGYGIRLRGGQTPVNSDTADILVWGSQIEAEAFTTAYVPTTTTVASSDFTNAITSTGLLVEEARTNICLQSEVFGTTWVNTNTDEPTTNNVAPDGTTTADEIAATSTADQAFAIYQDFTGLTATDVTTLSCYLKAGTNATFAQLVWDDAGGGADGCFCNFNLSTGAKGTVTALAAGTATASSIESVGNGWYRCSISGSIAVGTTGRFNIAITDIITAGVLEAANLADNDSIIAWGAQIEVAAFPTSYIPTTTVAVARNKDIVNTTDVTWYRQASPGTFYYAASQPVTVAALTTVMELHDGGTSDRILLDKITDIQSRGLIVSESSTVAALTPVAVWANGQTSRHATAFAVGDFEVYSDGNRAGTGDQAGALPVGMTELNVGTNVSDLQPFSGHIADLRYYNVRKDNSFIESMSRGEISAEAGVDMGFDHVLSRPAGRGLVQSSSGE